MSATLTELGFIAFAYFFAGFVLSVLLALPFGLYFNVRNFSGMASGAIRGA